MAYLSTQVNGRLLCSNDSPPASMTLNTLLVSGVGALFECGSQDAPFTGRFIITLTGRRMGAGYDNDDVTHFSVINQDNQRDPSG